MPWPVPIVLLLLALLAGCSKVRVHTFQVLDPADGVDVEADAALRSRFGDRVIDERSMQYRDSFHPRHIRGGA